MIIRTLKDKEQRGSGKTDKRINGEGCSWLLFFPAFSYHFFIYCLLIYIFCIKSANVLAQEGGEFPGKAPIEITADSLTHDKSKDTYYAYGRVLAIQGNSSIKADSMIVDMKASYAIAYGNVEAIDEGGNTLKGDTLELYTDTKVGVVINGRLFFKEGNVHVTGEKIKKTGNESYSAYKGTVTTCDCEAGESPAWSFYSNNADVTFGKYFTAWNSLFYIKSAPIFYFPYLIFPVKTERETGFLPPRIGYSNVRGLKLDNSFFWAISENTDATFYLDIEHSRGIGKGIEYRYVLSRTTDGEIYFYHFEEDNIKRVRSFRGGSANLSRPETASNERWLLQYKHNQILPGDIILKTNVNRVSDDEYFIDFAKDIRQRSLESLESNISLTKTWSKFNLVTQFRHFDNLLVADDNITFQRLPEINLTGRDQQVMGTPFQFLTESSFINFYREKGMEGQRLDVRPSIALPLNPGGYFDFRPSVGVRETFYWLNNNQPNSSYYDRTLYDFNADITATFVRISSWNENEAEQGLKKVKHSIRPKITYTYAQEVDQNHLPSFDGIDRIAYRNDFTYSVNSIVTGKFMQGGKPSYRDYLYMDLSQSYSIDHLKYSINETTGRITGVGEQRRPFSDVKGEIRLMPFSWTFITAQGQYDIYDNFIKEYASSLGLWDTRGDRVDIMYRYVSNKYTSYTNGALPEEYVNLSMKFKPVQAVDITYRNRYSISSQKTIEAGYGLAYQRQCWGAEIAYTEKLEERIFMITFNLLGIGQVGDKSP